LSFVKALIIINKHLFLVLTSSKIKGFEKLLNVTYHLFRVKKYGGNLEYAESLAESKVAFSELLYSLSKLLIIKKIKIYLIFFY